MQRPNEDPDGDMQYFYLNLRFPGQWFDNETGLFHNGFRDYNPQLGRYMQSDPLGLEAGFNTYSYVNGNPYRSVDPYGLLQRDANGNLIYIHQKYFMFSHGSGYKSFGSFGYLIADDGQKIQAYQNKLFFRPNANTDCHGFSFADGQYWINNSQVNKLLKGDGYNLVGSGTYNNGGYHLTGGHPKTNDIIVYKNNLNEVVHSGIYTTNGMIAHMPGVLGTTPITTPVYQGWGYNGITGNKQTNLDGYKYEIFRR